MVTRSVYEIVNDGGHWLCETSRAVAPGDAPGAHTLVFNGEGDYEGMTAYLNVDWSQTPFAFTGRDPARRSTAIRGAAGLSARSDTARISPSAVQPDGRGGADGAAACRRRTMSRAGHSSRIGRDDRPAPSN